MISRRLKPEGTGAKLGFYVAASAIHGKGLFAARRLPRGAEIGRYEGSITRRNGSHVLWVEDDDGEYFGIQGENELRYLNHSSSPNAEFYGDILYATRAIRPDEEITFHYGEDWADVD